MQDLHRQAAQAAAASGSREQAAAHLVAAAAWAEAAAQLAASGTKDGLAAAAALCQRAAAGGGAEAGGATDLLLLGRRYEEEGQALPAAAAAGERAAEPPQLPSLPREGAGRQAYGREALLGLQSRGKAAPPGLAAVAGLYSSSGGQGTPRRRYTPAELLALRAAAAAGSPADLLPSLEGLSLDGT